jgi:superfamily I DNA/RNA helicase
MTNTNDEGRYWATRNHYYVAVTRAKNDIFILCDDKPNVLSFYSQAQPIQSRNSNYESPTTDSFIDDLPF